METIITLKTSQDTLLKEIAAFLSEKKVSFSIEKLEDIKQKDKNAETEAFLYNSQKNSAKLFAKYL